MLGIRRDLDGWYYELPNWCVVEDPPVNGFRSSHVRPFFHRFVKPLHRRHRAFFERRGYTVQQTPFGHRLTDVEWG